MEYASGISLADKVSHPSHVNAPNNIVIGQSSANGHGTHYRENSIRVSLSGIYSLDKSIDSSGRVNMGVLLTRYISCPVLRGYGQR